MPTAEYGVRFGSGRVFLPNTRLSDGTFMPPLDVLAPFLAEEVGGELVRWDGAWVPAASGNPVQ
jgi:hypothetical protein